MPRTARTQKQTPTRPNRRHRGALFAVAVSLVLLAVGGAILFFTAHSSQQPSSVAVPKKQTDRQLGAVPLLDDSITSLALFLADSADDTFTGQTEAVLILTVDNHHGKLKLTSIPPGSVCAESYEQTGAEELLRTLNNNYNLDISDYLTINFAHLSAIIDALGGVNATLTGDELRALNNELYRLSGEVANKAEEDIAYGRAHTYPVITDGDYIRDIAGGLDLENGAYKDGEYHLNGNQAAAYGRVALAGDDDSGAHRRLTVATELLTRIAEAKTSDYTALLVSLLPHCETSLDEDKLSQLTPILHHTFTIETLAVSLASTDDDSEDEPNTQDYDLTSAAQRIDSFLYEDTSPYWEEFGNTGTAAGNQ